MPEYPGWEVTFSERLAENGYRLDIGLIEHALTPRQDLEQLAALAEVKA
ncbi:MAG TPA: hypothetical protein VHE82_06190 [Gemmatimonadaceae bacterium]|nr:hypothetical protein [Gemmatimonadaceae bacterium]